MAANRLLGFSQTVYATSTSVAYNYDANGAMTADGLRNYTYDAEGRLGTTTTGATHVSPTTRYAHNALGQRVFKTEPQYPPSQGDENDVGFMQGLIDFFTRLQRPNAAPKADAKTLRARRNGTGRNDEPVQATRFAIGSQFAIDFSFVAMLCRGVRDLDA